MDASSSGNVTVGRQGWSGSGRLLGAGTAAQDTHSELGLSAQPAAMQHGLLRVRPAGAANAAHDGPSSDVRSGSGRASAAASPQQQQQQQPAPTNQQEQAAGNGTQDSTTPVGQPQLVAPPGVKEPWYALALQHAKGLLLGTPPDPLSLAPPWAQWPDFSRCNNLNAALRGLWPSLSEAVETQLVAAMAPALLSEAAQQYGAGVLTGLSLTEFSLGEVPPRIDGIKVFREGGDEQLLAEMVVAWGSDIKATVVATLRLLGATLHVPLTVQRLQIHAHVRCSAQALVERWPYAGAVGLSLMGPPHVETEVPLPPAWPLLGGVDLLALPVVRGIFRVGLRLAARQLAAYPKGLSLPLVEGGAAAGGPVGVLEVRLLRIAGLRSEDLVGHSDPYVILRVHQGRQVRSRTISNNNSPEFDETFKLLVDDVGTQVLQVIAMDDDLIGGGKVMGVAQVPLKEAACVKLPFTRVPLVLTLHKLMGPQQGIGGVLQLPIRVAGLPITAAATGGRMLYENMAGALGIPRGGSQPGGGGSSGRTADHASPVLDDTGWLGPSEEWVEEHARPPRRTRQAPQQQQQQSKGGAAAAPGGPEATGSGSGGSQAGSSSASGSTYHTPASSLSGAAEASSLTDSSPQTAAAPLASSDGGLHAVRAAAVAAAVTAAAGVAATAPAAGPFAVVNTGTLSPATITTTTSTTSSSSSADAAEAPGLLVPASWEVQGSGLRRLASRSAPLLHVYGGGSTAAAAAASPPPPPAAAAAAASPVGPGAPGPEGAGPPSEVLRFSEAAAAKEQRRGALQELQGSVAAEGGASAGGGVGSARELSGDQLKRIYRGTVFLELTFSPFARPAGGPSGAGASPAGTSASLAAANNAPIQAHDKGILAVTLVRARGLGGWKGEADPYVTLSCVSPDAGGSATNSGSGSSSNGGDVRPQAPMRSTTIWNEDSPRFNEKFDFLGVRADSVLLATVWDQVTSIEAATSLRLSKERFRDQVLGRVKVPVVDVANSGRIRRMWPLQGALVGELEMVLQWIPAEQVQMRG